MANTVSASALRKQLWNKELYNEAMDDIYFMNKEMMGSGPDNIVEVKTDLKKDQGDRITYGMAYSLSGAAVTGDNELEGNGEAISFYNDVVLIDQARNAVELTGRLDEQKSAYEMRNLAKSKLKTWVTEFIERQIFMKLGGVTETDLTDVNSVVYSTNATWSNSANPVPAADEAAGVGARYLCADTAGLDSLAATDILTLPLIAKAKAKARSANPKVKPLRIGGRDFYVMFIHPWQAFDLKTDATANQINWEMIQRDAQIQGENNPIFTGALGVYDGVILIEHDYVPVCQASANFDGSGTAAGAQAFRSLLCGAQAIGFAEAGKFTGSPIFMEEDTKDLNNKAIFGGGFMGGIQKLTFNSLDNGVIAVDTGATSLA